MSRKTIHIGKPDDLYAQIARAAYPEYSGRKFKLTISDEPIDARSYWEGGSRDYFVFINLATLALWTMPQQSLGDAKVKGAEAVTLPDGIACVRHSFFCGTDMGLAIIISPENSARLLPPMIDTTGIEKAVLLATAALKSSYNGDKECRFHEAERQAGITREQWNYAKARLISRNLLTKSGAITPEGRNAVGYSNASTFELWKAIKEEVSL